MLARQWKGTEFLTCVSATLPLPQGHPATHTFFSMGQSKPTSCPSTSNPKFLAPSMISRTCAAFHMTFFGTQPTFTQVPPRAFFSTTATLTPYEAARRAEAMPPLPAPITRKSKCVESEEEAKAFRKEWRDRRPESREVCRWGKRPTKEG